MEEHDASARRTDEAEIGTEWRFLHREIQRRGVDVHLADDVAQETWLRTFARPARQYRLLRPWLRIVGLRVLGELARRDRSRHERERRAARFEGTEVGAPAPEDSRLMRLVQGLPEPYREVISLRYVEDLEIDEIARKLGRSPGTVRSQVKRGLDRLRVRLEEEEGERGSRTRRSLRSLFGWPLFRWKRKGSAPGSSLARLAVGSGCLALVAILVWTTARDEQEPGQSVARLTRAEAQASEFRGQVVAEREEAVKEPGPAVAPPIASIPPRSAFGTVRLPDGTPVAGATVWKGDIEGQHSRSVAVTDPGGRFAVERLEIADLLWATHPQWSPSRRSHPGSGSAGFPSELVLNGSKGRLDLFVSAESGRAVAGAGVELDWGFDHPANAFLSEHGEIQVESELFAGTTDDSGRLELAKPLQSYARLRIRIPGRTSHVRDIALADGDSRLDLVLPRSVALTGKVVDGLGEPTPGARVEVLTNAGEESCEIHADESGAFQIALEPGPFELRAREDPTRGVRRCRMEGALGEIRSEPVLLCLTDVGTLSGRAFVQGEPLANALVRCVPPWTTRQRSLAEYCTDSEGRFSFLGLAEEEEVKLQLYTQDLELLCERESVCVGAGEVVLTSNIRPSSRVLELEFECEDRSHLPTLVELRVPTLKGFRTFPVDASTRRCILLAPGTSPFVIFPWVPGLGSWRLDGAELAQSGVQRIRVPRPARISFQVSSPPDVALDTLRGGIRTFAFGCAWMNPSRGLQTYHELRLDPLTLTAEARVFPGDQWYYFRAPGLAHVGGLVNVIEGERVIEPVQLEPGVEAEVIVQFSGDVHVPAFAVGTAKSWREIEGLPVRLSGSQATFRVWLPLDTVELQSFMSKRHGSIRIPPGELVAGMPSPSFTIQLAPTEADMRCRFRSEAIRAQK